jgi:hypothetical protein
LSVSGEQAVPNTNGRFQDFQFGQIVWSPNQGGDMVVALYQQGSQLVLDWGNTFPFSYDKFIVKLSGLRWTPNVRQPEPYLKV